MDFLWKLYTNAILSNMTANAYLSQMNIILFLKHKREGKYALRLYTAARICCNCGAESRKLIPCTESIVERRERYYAVHLQCIPVQMSQQSVLLYLYNPELLNNVLTCPENIFFMRHLGYPPNPDKYLPMLLKKICDGNTFPHEIGLFLGYPLRDVEGYIANKGQNCLYNKYWKVYHDVERTRQKFDRYDACKERCKNARQTGAAFEEILQLYQ